jgi:hypothetical protein
MIWLIGAVLWVAIMCFVWALCVVAGRADEAAERMYEGMK